jgi:hypothetical protein
LSEFWKALTALATVATAIIAWFALGQRAEQVQTGSQAPTETQTVTAAPAFNTNQNIETQKSPQADTRTGVLGHDYCDKIAVPINLDPNGDNFLAVKGAPSLGAKRIHKLGPAAVVRVCGKDKSGLWLKIQYQQNETTRTPCSFEPPISAEHSCNSGWSYARYLSLQS